MAVGLTDLLESSGMNGVPAFVGLALLRLFCADVHRQRLGHLVDSGADFVPMFMLLGFHPAFAQIPFRIADRSVLPLAPVSPFVPLFSALTALPAGCPPRHLLLAGAPYPLIPRRLAAVAGGLVSGGLPIGPASIRGCLSLPMRQWTAALANAISSL